MRWKPEICVIMDLPVEGAEADTDRNSAVVRKYVHREVGWARMNHEDLFKFCFLTK